MIQWKNVSFSIRSGFWLRQRSVIEEVDFHIGRGEAVGLVGPNGAGKTTTIKLGAGLLKPDKGEILLEGVPSASIAAKARLGLLTENQYVYGHLKLREWLEMLGALSGMTPRKRKARAQKMLELFELDSRAGQMIRTLSKGQIQRAGLAQAFLNRSDILLLDEPMSGLDPRWRYLVQALLIDFKNKGGTLLFSSHILSDVERISDKLVLLDKGAIRWKGRLDSLPREITGYEVVCRKNDSEILHEHIGVDRLEPRPDGYIAFVVNQESRDKVLSLAAEGRLFVEALKPIKQEMQDILFGFETGETNRKER